MPISFRDLLVADHEDLDLRLDELKAAFQTGDRGAAREAYRRFEGHLTEHLAVEEKYLFPEFVAVEPRETEELRAEHAAIRTRVEELAVGVDLHQVRLTAIEDLVGTLRRHAAREDALLYRWADHAFSELAQRPRIEGSFTHVGGQVP